MLLLHLFCAGNLWGSGNFRGHPEGLAYAAKRSTLWLGSDWSAEEIAQLRKFNPNSIVLTSINACETNREDLPDDYYLTNISRPASTKGRLQSWPGRLGAHGYGAITTAATGAGALRKSAQPMASTTIGSTEHMR